jgi:hypothetical protein
MAASDDDVRGMIDVLIKVVEAFNRTGIAPIGRWRVRTADVAFPAGCGTRRMSRLLIERTPGA